MTIFLVLAALCVLSTLFAVGLVRGGKGPARTTRRPDLEPVRRHPAAGEAKPTVPAPVAQVPVKQKHRESAEDR